MVCLLSEIPLEKTEFFSFTSSYQLDIASEWVLLPLSVLRAHLAVQACAGWHGHMCTSPIVSRSCFIVVFSPHCSYSLSSSSSSGFPELQGEKFDETSHLVLSVSRFLILSFCYLFVFS